MARAVLGGDGRKTRPYVGWMETTAGNAEHTALQAKNAAAAFEAAIAVTVPPATVFANRAHAQNLLATNVFGQNTAAIQAAEAQYQEMWAQCAAAMHGYATGASTSVQLAGFTPPGAENTGTDDSSPTQRPERADAAGRADQGPTTILGGLLDSSESDGWLGDPGGGGLGPNANLWNTLTSTDMANPAMVTSVLADLATVQEFNEAAPGAFAPGSFAPVAPAMSTMGTAGLVSAGGPAGAGTPPVPTAVSAAMGRAMGVGTLSAPPAWGRSLRSRRAARSCPGTARPLRPTVATEPPGCRWPRATAGLDRPALRGAAHDHGPTTLGGLRPGAVLTVPAPRRGGSGRGVLFGLLAGPAIIGFAGRAAQDRVAEHHRLGQLVAGDRFRRVLDDPGGVGGVGGGPRANATTATTSWPQRSEGRPATTTSATAGCEAIADSTSSAKIFSPPELIVTESRPSSSIVPPSRCRARSPGTAWRTPPITGKVAAVLVASPL